MLSNRVNKTLVTLILSVSLLLAAGSCRAEVPYRNYTYDFWGNSVPAPQAYLPTRVITGASLSVGDFSDPHDIYVGAKGQILVADTGNHRVVWLDNEWNAVRVLGEFDNFGRTDRLRSPQGVYMRGDGSVFVADTGNSRIVEFGPDGEFVREIGPPQADVAGVIPDGFRYQPVRLTVDPVGRMYVVSSNSYEGLTVFDADGSFSGFVGAPRVTPSASELFWFRIATQEQKDRMALFLPTQFASIDMDHRGFNYVVEAGPADDDSIRRLNPVGVDVLVRNWFHKPKGDVGADLVSYLYDVHVQDNGIYSVLDHASGRVFFYDWNGWLLYTFGAIGELKGAFRDPAAIDMIGSNMLVLDRGQRHITLFEPTPYAQAINAALELYHAGRYDESTRMWEVVLSYNANYDLSYAGIGRALLLKDDARNAMEYFKLGQDRTGYSKAFYQYRREYIMDHLGVLLTGVIVAISAVFVATKLGLVRGISSRFSAVAQGVGRTSSLESSSFRSRILISGIARAALLKARETVADLRYSLYLATSPIEASLTLKKTRKRALPASVIMLLLMTLTYTFMRQYTGFIFNYRDLSKLNIYTELLSVLVPFGLWCIVNWALTTLMEGKGRIEDIFVNSAFALTPAILVNVPLTVLSNVITAEEGTFYYIIMAFGIIWTVVVLLAGNMTIHEYSLGKTLVTAILTVIGMIFVLFLCILFASLVSIMTGFARGLYTEIIFR